jgi:competence protein ComEA
MPGSSPEPEVAPSPVDPPRPIPGLSFTERVATWRHEPRLVTAGLALVALVAGAWWVRVSMNEPSAALPKSSSSTTTRVTEHPDAGATPRLATTTTAGVVVVDVVGAVRHAGVVSLPTTARVVDAVNAAGGALPAADLDRINLAAHLVDGMRIAVPRRGVASDPAGPTADPGASGPSAGTSAGGAPTAAAPLDLNTATEPQLETLPGIGPSLAQAIIAERDKEGGFHSVDDLRRVRGIGDVRFAQLRPLVTV